MAGVEGFEPSHAGIRIRCLNHLATPQSDRVKNHPDLRARILHASLKKETVPLRKTPCFNDDGGAGLRLPVKTAFPESLAAPPHHEYLRR